MSNERKKRGTGSQQRMGRRTNDVDEYIARKKKEGFTRDEFLIQSIGMHGWMIEKLEARIEKLEKVIKKLSS